MTRYKILPGIPATQNGLHILPTLHTGRYNLMFYRHLAGKRFLKHFAYLFRGRNGLEPLKRYKTTYLFYNQYPPVNINMEEGFHISAINTSVRSALYAYGFHISDRTPVVGRVRLVYLSRGVVCGCSSISSRQRVYLWLATYTTR